MVRFREPFRDFKKSEHFENRIAVRFGIILRVDTQNLKGFASVIDLPAFSGSLKCPLRNWASDCSTSR